MGRTVQLPFPPADREELWWVIRALFGVTIPRTKVCPDHCAPFDAFADAWFRECTLPGYEGPITRAIWHASRGLAGKSFMTSTLGLAYAYILGADITILGGSMSQSANVHEYMQRAMEFEGIPDAMTMDVTATRIKLSNAGRVRPLPASQKNVRGPHPSILLCMAGWTRVNTPDGPRRIDELAEGQKVAVPGGWDVARRVIDQGEKPTVVVTFADGRQITCTPDHRFATSSRWVQAQDLTSATPLRAPFGADSPVVVSVCPGPVVRCWDITTDSHTFFAEGVLVHNCDEADEMELDIYDAALGQPLPQKSYLGSTVDIFTVVSSTWQNPEGTFTTILRRAEEKHQPVYRWCYKESSNPVDGWLSQATIQAKRDEVSAEMFRVEYDLGEPSIENRAFDPEAVDRAFCRRFKPDDAVGEGRGYIEHKVGKDFEEYRFERRVNAASYVATADWAKEKDKTVITVARVDGEHRRLVYYLRVNRRPYPVMIGYFNKAVGYYRAQPKGVWHDSTGLGNVVNDYLDARATPFPMVGDKRAKMLNDFVSAVEKGTWEIPRIMSAYLAVKYCRTGDLYRTNGDFHLPDVVCALALAEYAAKRYRPTVAPVVVKRGPDAQTALETALSGERRREDAAPVTRPSISLVV